MVDGSTATTNTEQHTFEMWNCSKSNRSYYGLLYLHRLIYKSVDSDPLGADSRFVMICVEGATETETVGDQKPRRHTKQWERRIDKAPRLSCYSNHKVELLTCVKLQRSTIIQCIVLHTTLRLPNIIAFFTFSFEYVLLDSLIFLW